MREYRGLTKDGKWVQGCANSDSDADPFSCSFAEKIIANQSFKENNNE